MTSAVFGAAGSWVATTAVGTGGALGMTAATWGQIGWTAGVLAANYLFAPDGPDITTEGSRLNDLKVTSSTYGMDIPRVYGAYRIAGNIIWALPLAETRHEERQEEGKGGGGSSETNIWYTYAGTWAVALCEGPIAGVNKIWFDSKLVYDSSVSPPPITFEDDFLDILIAVHNGIDYDPHGISDNIEIYTGTANQPINWRIQADKPDTPAYRNVAYIVFNNIQLEDHGNRIPNVTCEVVKNGVNSVVRLDDIQLPMPTNEVLPGNILHVDDNYIYHYINNYHLIVEDAGTTISRTLKYNSNYISNYTLANKNTCEDESTCYITDAGFNVANLSCGLDFGSTMFIGRDGLYDHWYGFPIDCCLPEIFKNITTLTLQADSLFWYKDEYVFDWINGILINSLGVSVTVPTDHISGNAPITHLSVYNGNAYIISPKSTEIEVTIYDQQLNQMSNTVVSGTFDVTNYGTCVVDYNGYHLVKGSVNWIYTNLDFDLSLKNSLTFSAIGSCTDSVRYHNGKIYFYVETIVANLLTERYIRVWQVGGITSSGISVGQIVEDLSLESGLNITDINTVGGTDLVTGYVIKRNEPARASIEVLLSAYEYALVETNNKIVLRKQDQASLLTVNEEDLGANTDNKFEQNTRQDLDLIRSLTIRYANSVSDYQTSVQMVMRIDVNATAEQTVELPLAFTDTQGKQLAEKMLYRSWLMRQSFNLTLPFISYDGFIDYKSIISGDIITVTLDGISKEIRVTKITTTEDNKLKVEGIAHDYGTFISTAIGADTGSNGAILAEPIGPTIYEILDIPTLNNNYLYNEGLYTCATGYTTSWSGCNVLSRPTEADDFTVIYTLLGSTPIGVALSVLLSGLTYKWDYINSVTVTSGIDLVQYSTTKELVLTGVNYCLLGTEVFQFRTATEIDDGTFVLTELLRGRRGTESEVGTHVIGEKFVFLKASTFGFFEKTINNNDLYTAIALGSLELEEQKQIQYTGKNLKPFNVSYLKGTFIAGDEKSIKWMRRSRYISGYLKTLPLVDTPELYEIDVVLREDGDVISTHQSSTGEFIYTAANHATDSLNVTYPLGFWVYQYSGAYGRGEGQFVFVGERTKDTYLVAHWTCDETSSPLIDSVGSFDLTGIGSITYGTSSALLNDGGNHVTFLNTSDDKFLWTTVNNTEPTIPTTGEIGVSLFYIDVAGYADAPLLWKAGEWYVSINSKHVSAGITNSTSEVIRSETVETITITEEVHIVVNFTGTTSSDEFDIYINNVKVPTTDKTIVTDATKTYSTLDNRIYFGLNHPNCFATTSRGIHDDIRIYDRGLSADVVSEIYATRSFLL